MKELGLYRTKKGNYIPYNADGNGRDRYIAFDNAGMFKLSNSIRPEYTRRTGTTLFTKMHYKSMSPYAKTPNFHYHSDGNGRDSYIYSNGGGLIYDSKPLGTYKLTDFLRESGENMNSNNNIESNWVSKDKEKYFKYLRNKEKEIIYRLYEKDKKKFLKDKKNENEDSLINETDELQLPTILDRRNPNTLDNLNELNKSDGNLNLDKKKTNILKKKNMTLKSLEDEKLMKFLNQINNFDVSKKLKKCNKSFNQPYIHLKNVDYNYA